MSEEDIKHVSNCMDIIPKVFSQGFNWNKQKQLKSLWLKIFFRVEQSASIGKYYSLNSRI